MTQNTSPAHAIGMSNDAAASRIEEDYSGSVAHQHLIELFRNGTQQPGTTYIAADIVKLPSTGALKRAVVNNGPALTAEQMNQYMTTIGQGSGELWRLTNTRGNRHAGARSALLPWTDLLILSWDEAVLPDGLEMTLYKNPTTAQYEYTPAGQPNPALLALLTARPQVRAAGHGVAFVYLGRDQAVDGPLADPAKGETPGSAADALRDRIFDPAGVDGDAIEMSVAYPMPASAGGGVGGRKVTGASGKHFRLDGRSIKGHHEWSDRTTDSGTVVVDEALGVSVSWWLLPYEMEPTDRRLPFGGKGHIVVRYKNESMPLAAPGGDYPDLGRTMRTFGVHLSEVYNRLALVIDGPTDPGADAENPQLHIHQTPARSGLTMSNGTSLPIDLWAQRFIDQMPASIVAANKAARERNSERATVTFSTGDRLKERLGSRITSILQSRRRLAGSGVLGRSGVAGTDYLDGLVATDAHEPEGPPSDEGVPGVTPAGTSSTGKKAKKKGARRSAKVDAAGESSSRRFTKGAEAATEVKPRPAPIPEPSPMDSHNWHAQGFDAAHFASWDRGSGVVYFNTGHRIFHTQVAYFTGEWLEMHTGLSRRVTAEDVRQAVHEAYFVETIARILHYSTEVGVQQAVADLDEKSLTIAAHGFENVQECIVDNLQKRSRGGVVAAGEAASAA